MFFIHLLARFGLTLSFFFVSCPNSDHAFQDETVADDGKKFRFSLNVFRFKDSNGMIYIHCSAHVCLKNSKDTKCQFGCNNRRRRRSVGDNSLTRLDDLSKDYDIRTGLIIITESSKSKLFEIPYGGEFKIH